MHKPIFYPPGNTKPSPAAPPVYRPQSVPKVLQTKTVPGRPTNLLQALSPAIPPRIVRPEALNSVQSRSVLQQRKAPVAPPVYRPRSKSTNLQQSHAARMPLASPVFRPQPSSPGAVQQSAASLPQRSLPVPSARAVVQRYTLIRTSSFRGKISQHGRYVTGENLSEIYVFPGNDVERSAYTGRTRVIEGTTYEIWKPSLVVIGDCVAAMEELMHGKKLKYGAPDISEYRDLGRGTKRAFGESDDDNRKRGKITDLGDDADPQVGEGYVIARQGHNRHLSLPQFHGAAVVAQDGEDNITLEASAPLSGAVPVDRVAPVYDMYSVLKKRQSFKSRYKAMYGKDASVSVVKKVRRRLPKKALDQPRSLKVVDYV